MNTTEEILKLRRAGKSIEFIKSKFGFSSDGSVYHHLNKAKLKVVYLTENEILLLRQILSSGTFPDRDSGSVGETIASIGEALKLAERR